MLGYHRREKSTFHRRLTHMSPLFTPGLTSVCYRSFTVRRTGIYAERHTERKSESTRTNPAEERDTTDARLENPSGVLHLFQHESVPILIDAILTLPPGREFNKTELVEHAGVTRQTVSNYIVILLKTAISRKLQTRHPAATGLPRAKSSKSSLNLLVH